MREADTDRLDWIESRQVTVVFLNPDHHTDRNPSPWRVRACGGFYGHGATLREAIDRARGVSPSAQA